MNLIGRCHVNFVYCSVGEKRAKKDARRTMDVRNNMHSDYFSNRQFPKPFPVENSDISAGNLHDPLSCKVFEHS